MNLVLLGPPGAGKGTQAIKITEKIGVPHISTGDILRAAIGNKTELGMQAKFYMDKGELVPDSVVIGIVEQRLKQQDCQAGWLLDGFPRTVAQAQAMTAEVDLAIFIDVPFESLVKRLTGRRVCADCSGTYHIDLHTSNVCAKCGGELIQRKDDTESTVRNRLDVYDKNTRPLIEYYQQQGCLKKVNGSQKIDNVFADICDIIGQ